MTFTHSYKLARRFLTVKTSNHTNLRYKSSENYVKCLMKEFKLTFGKLIETKKEKLRRLKLEQKGKVAIKKSSKIDSEILWRTRSKPSTHVEKKIISYSQASNLYLKEGEWIDWSTLEPGLNLSNLKESVKTKQASIDQITNEENEKKMKQENIAIQDDNQCITNLTPGKEKLINKMSQLTENILSTSIYANNINKNLMPGQSDNLLRLSSTLYNECVKFPSVTKILTATMSEEAKMLLDKWEKQMIEKLGVEGFRHYRQELLQNGKFFHSAIENFLLQESLDMHKNVQQTFKSVSSVLKDVTNVRAIESHVVHPTLQYRGYIDCIASYRGNFCLIDWKKSDKRKDSISLTYDAPLQVAAYIGALNADAKYPFQIKRGLIVVAYTNGQSANVHEISGKLLQIYWESWLQRLKKYYNDANVEFKSSG